MPLPDMQEPSARLLKERGLAMARLKRFSEAAALLSRACAMAPGDAFAQEQLGRAEFRAGNLQAALEAFTRAEQLRPCKDSSIFSIRAAVKNELGHTDAAWDDIERWPSLSPLEDQMPFSCSHSRDLVIRSPFPSLAWIPLWFLVPS